MPNKKRGAGFSRSKGGRFYDKRRPGVSRTDLAERERNSSSLQNGADTPDMSNADSKNSNISKSALISAVSEVQHEMEEETYPIPCQEKVKDLVSVVSEDEHASDEVHSHLNIETEQNASWNNVYEKAFNLFRLLLPTYWRVIQGREGIYLIYISKADRRVQIQREVFSGFNGKVEVSVHNKLDLTK